MSTAATTIATVGMTITFTAPFLASPIKKYLLACIGLVIVGVGLWATIVGSSISADIHWSDKGLHFSADLDDANSRKTRLGNLKDVPQQQDDLHAHESDDSGSKVVFWLVMVVLGAGTMVLLQRVPHTATQHAERHGEGMQRVSNAKLDSLQEAYDAAMQQISQLETLLKKQGGEHTAAVAAWKKQVNELSALIAQRDATHTGTLNVKTAKITSSARFGITKVTPSWIGRIIQGINALARVLDLTHTASPWVVPITQQIEMLAQAFDLDPAKALAYANTLGELPKGARGWFAIPTVDALAKRHFPRVQDPADRYRHAIQLISEKIASCRACRCDVHASAWIRMRDDTAATYKRIETTQQLGDFVIIAAQLGTRHVMSPYEARGAFTRTEFGLNSLSVAAMLLTHERMLRSDDSMAIMCAGDEDTYGVFLPAAPSWYSESNLLELKTNGSLKSTACIGVASGFLPT